MSEFHLFRCCQQHPLSTGSDDAPPRAGCWAAPIGGGADEAAKPDFYLSGPLIEGRTVRLSRSRTNAFHEAAHAIIYLALGARVAKATIDGQPLVRHVGTVPYPANVVAILAGDAGAAWARSEIAKAPDDELASWVGGIRNLCGGSCDRCKAVRICLVGTTLAPDDEVVATFRYLENATGMIVRSPQVWAAISELADALMSRGTLGSRAILKICRRHFEPGAFAHLFHREDHNA